MPWATFADVLSALLLACNATFAYFSAADFALYNVTNIAIYAAGGVLHLGLLLVLAMGFMLVMTGFGNVTAAASNVDILLSFSVALFSHA